MKRYGYVRVSSKDQNLNRQLDAFSELGLESKYIYIDKMSGKDFKRPNYKKMVSKLRAGDTVVVMSIDRLGRNYDEILEQWRMLTKEKRVDIEVIDMPLLNTNYERDGLIGVLSQIWFCRYSLMLRKRNVRLLSRDKQKVLWLQRPEV